MTHYLILTIIIVCKTVTLQGSLTYPFPETSPKTRKYKVCSKYKLEIGL